MEIVVIIQTEDEVSPADLLWVQDKITDALKAELDIKDITIRFQG